MPLTKFGIIIFSALTIGFGQQELSKLYEIRSSKLEKHEALYLPNGTGLQLISFGYRNALADMLWFNTISYFGKHFKGDRKFEWFEHMCNLVTDLNPKAKHVYEFGGMMLAWEANQPEESIKLVSKALQHFPNDWSLYYLRGFNYMFFLKDNAKAREDFISAAKQADAPSFMAILASKQLASSESLKTAITFLEQSIKNSSDPNQRKALEDRYKEAVFAYNVQSLEHASKLYKNKIGSQANDIQQLIQSGIIKIIPQDPYGGTFFIDQNDFSIKSSSGVKVKSFYKSNADK